MIRAIVTDIEGTTSSLAFVKDTLFPYAAQVLPTFLRQHEDESEIKRLLQEVGGESGVKGTTAIIDVLLRWIAEDRKVTPLKTLQGLVWAAGYANGQLKGHVYADAAHCLHNWHTNGIRLFVYSSGSVQAQKLLFSNTAFGNLANLFEGFFDTHIGGKRDPASYRRIISALHLNANEVLFLSDVCAELDAANEVGMETCQVLREGVNPQACGHPQVIDFNEIGNIHKELASPNASQ